MKNGRRHNLKQRTVFALFAVCIALLGACSGTDDAGNTGRFSVTDPATLENLDAIFAEKLPGPALPPDVKPEDIICTDYTAQGLLRICYQSEPGKKLKLEVAHGSDKIHYNLAGEGSIEDFPLQYGDGEYTVRIMENIKDNEYYAVEFKTFDVTLEYENRVYLNSVQNINWNYDMEPIHDIRYIVAGSLAESEALLLSCTEDIHQFVVENIQYDTVKVFSLLYDYLPNIVDTYTTGIGICYDYASLFAAMLRSIGIPAKLVKGYASYAPDTYHAWNEVYIEEEWILVDITRDASLWYPGANIVMHKESADYTKIYQY
jgi:Transglutaminase-like enzymes, putative cysteine proteases